MERKNKSPRGPVWGSRGDVSFQAVKERSDLVCGFFQLFSLFFQSGFGGIIAHFFSNFGLRFGNTGFCVDHFGLCFGNVVSLFASFFGRTVTCGEGECEGSGDENELLHNCVLSLNPEIRANRSCHTAATFPRP